MAFDLETIEKQAIALLGLATRDASGNAVYSTTLGDLRYAREEISRAALLAAIEIMKTICETDGHPHRSLFSGVVVLSHAEPLPDHYGSMGVPRITPYDGAANQVMGKRKSIEEVLAYRANPGNMYSSVNHDVSSGGAQSKLAGFYAVDEESQIFYFTGYSAEANLVAFTDIEYTSLPDAYYPTATGLCIANLKKDGDRSDIFSYYAEFAAQGLGMIRNRESGQPSLKKVAGSRDSGTK